MPGIMKDGKIQASGYAKKIKDLLECSDLHAIEIEEDMRCRTYNGCLDSLSLNNFDRLAKTVWKDFLVTLY